MISARRTGGSVLDSFAHPVSIALFGYLTVRSHVQHARGALKWKGRAVPSLVPTRIRPSDLSHFRITLERGDKNKGRSDASFAGVEFALLGPVRTQ